MHTVRADPGKNRLYLTFRGFSEIAEAEAAHRDVEAAVRELRPGFDVVTDRSHYKPVIPEITPIIQQIQGLLRQSGLRRIVRVASPNPLTNIQFERAGRVTGVAATTVSSVAEAEAWLDQAPA
jgi:hypothetical protein